MYTLHSSFPSRHVPWQPEYACGLDVVSNDDLGNGEAAGARWMLRVGWWREGRGGMSGKGISLLAIFIDFAIEIRTLRQI